MPVILCSTVITARSYLPKIPGRYSILMKISVLTVMQNKRIVPFKYAHKILFTDPEFIVVMDCPCKKALGDKEENINSCLFVGSGTGKFWLDRCKKYHPRRVTQQEALDLIKTFRKKGYITQAFFKVATGGSTGVICNCHPDTCVALEATALTRKIDPRILHDRNIRLTSCMMKKM